MQTRNLIIAGLVVSLSAGCSEIIPKVNKEEAHRQWDAVRGKLQYKLALESFNSGQIEQSRERLRESLLLDPTQIEAHILMAKILLERGETAAAEQALAKAAETAPDHAEVNYLRGVIAQRYEKFDEAVTFYQKASRKDPMNAQYVTAVAETLVSLGRPEEAISLARSRWTDFEQSSALRALVGEIQTILGRHEEAADAFREASRLSPDDKVLKGQLGAALMASSRYEEAVEALSAATNHEAKPSAAMLVMLGRCYAQLGKLDDAKTAFRKAVAEEPNCCLGWSWLAQVSISSGDMVTARRAAGEAVKLSPEKPNYALLLAYVCWRQSDDATARRLVQRVLDKHPDDQVAQLLMGKLREKNAKRPPAQESSPRTTRTSNSTPFDEVNSP